MDTTTQSGGMAAALQKLAWMREQKIWPNGKRYLWTDAFGVVLLVSVYRATSERRWLDEAEWVVREVDRVLGRKRGIRIGEAADRDGQYFHYLAMWLFALARLGRIDESYRRKGIALAKDIHRPFVVPGRGVRAGARVRDRGDEVAHRRAIS